MEKTEKVEQVEKVSLFKRITNHVEKHKTKYGAGVCVGIVLVGYNTFYKNGNSFKLPKISSSGTNNVISPNIITNIINIKVDEKDHLENIIRCVETGEIFKSQRKAAEVMDINPSKLSQHLIGKKPNVGGYTFERIKDTLKSEE